MGPPALSFKQYTDAMFFATKWDLTGARRFMIDTLGSCLPDDPVVVIQMANVCEVNAPWLLHQYSKLCEREEPLSDSEASRLSTLCVVAISRIREIRTRYAGKQDGLVAGANWMRNRYTNEPYCEEWHRGGKCDCAPPIDLDHALPSTEELIKREEYLMKRITLEVRD